jgi:HAD superfamily hydrolase (TIGR01549 family)
MLQAVILDIDGTLVETGIDWEGIRSKLKNLLNIRHPLKPLAPTLPKLIRNFDQLKVAYEIVSQEENRSVLNVKMDQELKQLIKSLKDAGIKIGIVTLRGKDSAELILSKLGIRKYVDALITRDESLDRRRQLELILETLRASKDTAMFLGDTNNDYEAGKSLGIKTIIIQSNGIQGVPQHLKEVLRDLINQYCG